MELRGMTHPKLLALLLLGDGAAVSIERIVEALWDDAPPSTARRQVRNRVASLRRVLKGHGHDPIQTVAQGYRIPSSEAHCDSCEFARRSDRARSHAHAGRLPEAVRAMDDALAVWTGPALMGLTGKVFEASSHRLEESRYAAIESRAAWQLRLGRSDVIIGELSELVAAKPYRQQLLYLYMSALQLSGRAAEALKAYEIHRLRLNEELGIEPGQVLQRLHVSILRDEEPFADSRFPAF
ncbi:AfsR/SARP family transcriptional regulator [Glycomyces dulcitolivorans]|uniref:AfsR/SARP family transcriptional regulator n=1 Tax=Glycomyces dulcitolivorans TaxID=2200759 RepID=UPI00130074C6|nr:AfsR/SARP family transcriptional regulator [Glycomyces dulcitolivorans]